MNVLQHGCLLSPSYPFGSFLLDPAPQVRCPWLTGLLPACAEVVLPPLVSLEVTSVRAVGDVSIVDVRPTPHLPPITVEKVLGRRRQLLEDQALNFAEEVRAACYTATRAIATQVQHDD